jgi:hypothetical protein
MSHPEPCRGDDGVSVRQCQQILVAGDQVLRLRCAKRCEDLLIRRVAQFRIRARVWFHNVGLEN